MTIHLKGVSKTYTAKPLFEDITLQIGSKSRVGLIGRNGCGKSTLLQLIMKHIEPDSGTVSHSPYLQVNYLSQEPRITPHFTLTEEMRSVFSELHTLEAQEEKIIAQLANPALEAQHTALTEELYEVQQTMHRMDAQTLEARIDRILKGLGFSQADYDRKTAEFSGGWQMRINLAKVLLEGSDILLLDEPTNHLDLETCEWMETFLKSYPGGIVVVSHDRRFLDSVVTEVAELELGKMTVWHGNYTAYLAQKAAALEHIEAAHNRQSKELEKQTAFVERFKASATRGTQAKSREKQLAKIERIEVPQQDNRRMTVRFPEPQPSGREVLTLKNISKSFEEKKLFEKIDADIERQQRIFLLGDNGTGKTTLLRLIQKLELPDSGEITRGHNVLAGYFSQNQLETLDPNLTVLETIQNAEHKLTNTEVRGLLGRFLFTGDQVFKKVSVLSGGEKSKLALAKLMLAGPNLLLLDEPTNHMDIPAKEVITEALQEYKGSMLCISHDRHFIQTLATHIWEIHDGMLLTYCGGYDYYRSKREEIRKTFKKAPPKPAGNSPQKLSEKQEAFLERKETEKKLKRVEKQILKAEAELKTLQESLNNPNLANNYPELQKLSEQVAEKQRLLDTLNTQWAKLGEQLEKTSS